MAVNLEKSEQEMPANKFSLFKAEWRSGIALPGSWYEEHIPIKPKFVGFFWAPQLPYYHAYTTEAHVNAVRFRELMMTLSNFNLEGYEFIASELQDPIRATAINQLAAIQELKPGDCCLIFYSGIGLCNKAKEESKGHTIPEPLFHFDVVTEPLKSISDTLEEVAKNRGVHIFVILDFHAVLMAVNPSGGFKSIPGSSLVVLESPAPMIYNADESQSADTNFFYEQLSDIIRTSGAKLRYANLADRLNLRYISAGMTERCRLAAMPDAAAHTYIFSGVSSGKSKYQVYYSEANKEWQINAGALNGILPSLSFMHTKFSLNDGREVSVKDVFDSYSTLMEFDEPDTENTFDATLLQTAVPKMEVGFHHALSAEDRATLAVEARIFGLECSKLMEDAGQPDCLIGKAHGEYYLVRKSNRAEDEKPLFSPEVDVIGFLRKMEAVAKCRTLLELDNLRANISQEDVSISIETIEGSRFTSETLPAASHVNPASLVLNYRSGFPPMLRCKLTSRLPQDEKYYADIVYVDNSYRIKQLQFSAEGLLKMPSPDLSITTRNFTNAEIDEFYIENKINDVQDYLLVFISSEPFNIDPLIYPLYPDIINRVIKPEHFVVLPQGKWVVRKIPVHVKYDDRTFLQTVQDTIASRPVEVADDWHKGRWGRSNKRNGFELSAKVRNIGNGLFNVRLQVTHDSADLRLQSVAFLLHESFSEPLLIETFNEENIAYVEVTAYEDFTAAAILYDGTELELDLSEQSGLPNNFYALSPDDRFRQRIEVLLKETPITVANDLQKGRWGGQKSKQGYYLDATVKRSLIPGLYNVRIWVIKPPESSASRVAILLHDSFSKPLRILTFENYEANLKVTAYEDFTVAAIVDDGTQLELDLSQMPDLPKGFYSKGGSDESFKERVEAMLNERPVTVSDDLQKNRWGGRAEKNGKVLSATVVTKSPTHRVILTVSSTNKHKPLEGEVVFFLHDSFDEQVVFCQARKGVATYELDSLEAFTVGACTEDGFTELELDLNEVRGFPAAFYCEIVPG